MDPILSPDINDMLRDLLWLQAVIATELIQVTKNTSSLLRRAPPPAHCLEEHTALKTTALQIAEKYRPESMLRQHIEGHH